MESKILTKIRKLLAKANCGASSESEVETCLKLAQKLMMQHNLDKSDVEIHISDINKEVVYSDLWKYFKYKTANFEWNLLDTIAEGYNCRVFQGVSYDFDAIDWRSTKRTKLSIVGTFENRMIAKELYQSCVEIFLNLSEIRYNEYKILKKNTLTRQLNEFGMTKNITIQWLEKSKLMSSKKTFITSYLIGCTKGIQKYLEEQRKEILAIDDNASKWGLIVLKNDELIEKAIPDIIGDFSKKAVKSVAHCKEGFLQGVEDGNRNQAVKELET
ncbi:DUF2786 domain-containing protein [Flavobacterium davisii]|uniref:DUF2786 domain-containing protein n=1 Tax=Flavobacterium columnare TaxID=996 RepID=A0A8G0P7Q0_9FLAO|nr:DUF2786 domain-containing protein [Flavobacterium davisii]QYS89144.1 DUF2786 domain-containing protein [Flavobacterium davisii]